MRKLLLIISAFLAVYTFAPTTVKAQPSMFYKLIKKAATGGGGGPSVLFEDNFVDAPGTNLTAHTMDNGSGWIMYQGNGCGTAPNYTIQSNAALAPNGIFNIAATEGGSADGILTADLKIPNSSTYLIGLAFRISDCGHYISAWIERDGGTPYLRIRKWIQPAESYIDGGATNISSAVTNSTVTMTITLSGDNIIVTLSTGESKSVTESYNNTATKHGIFSYDGGGSYPAVPVEKIKMTN